MIDNKLHGLYQRWHNNGQKSVESNYTDGKFHGLHESWYYNGIEYKSQEECEEASITNKSW